MRDPEWRPTDACEAIMAAHEKAAAMVDRVHRAQGKLMQAMLYLDRGDTDRVRSYIVDAADELGLPPGTWNQTE